MTLLPNTTLFHSNEEAFSNHSLFASTIEQPLTPHLYPQISHPMITRDKDGIVQPRLNPIILLTKLEPTSYKLALKHPIWLEAMKAGHDALLTNNTWTVTTLPPNRRVFGCKWVFRIKQNHDGSILKYKAKLVAKGFHQVQGFDFHETFSPMVKPVTVRIILILAMSIQWQITQLDVNSAFLNDILTKEVYKQ